MSETAFDIEEFLKSLTKKPGVYRMIGAEGVVLYVGKARNLKSRVTSYFRASGLQARTMAMVARIEEIEITVTRSETEALLLEQSLIKEMKPPYNIILRDDKSYPYIHLTGHGEFPRLSFHRGAKAKRGRYFGPFPSAYAVRDSLNILQKVFQLRNCDESYFKNRSRPCLQHQIQRCTAPCVQAISPEDYGQDVDLAVMFLEGKSRDVLEVFKQKMTQASERLEFERAARYRDQITHLRKVQENQWVHGATGDVDIFALAADQGIDCIQAVFVRGGRMLGNRTFFPRNELAVSEPELLNAFLSQYYLAGRRRDIPKDIIVSHGSDDDGVLASALSDLSKRKVGIAKQVRGQRAQWLKLAKENVQVSLQNYLSNKRTMFGRFVALQDALGFDELPQRLECFDISHTMGEATVASCVVFDTNGPLKSDYRRFNIEGIVPGDDYAAMEQVLRRRYRRIQKGEVAVPDLLIIDGGKGQLGRAHQVLTELRVENLCILGIAKGEDRKAGLERFFLDGEEVRITGTSPEAHLLQHIRDEAHRFAITGHRQRRSNKRNRSPLEQVPGIGPKRRKALLTHFGGLPGIMGASTEEISKVPGINARLARQVYETLHL